MPEITFNFNVNISSDERLLSFFETIQQRIKPVEKEPVIIQGIPRSSIIKQVKEREEIKKPVALEKDKIFYKEVRKKGVNPLVSMEALKGKILSFVREKGITKLPYSSGIASQKGKELREDLYIYCGTRSNLQFKQVIDELVKEGKLERLVDPDCNNKRSFVYKIKEKFNSTKALSYFKEKKEEYEEEEEEDMLRGETAIDVPSPERSPRREIRRKCPKCGGQLWKRNSAEDDYMDAESRFLELPKEIYYQCFQCGSIIKEKEIEKEAVAA